MATLRRAAASPWLPAALTFVLAIALAVVSHRLWRADLGVPLRYGGDSLQNLMFAKGIHEHGWMVENGNLGAPFGLQLYDFPEGGWISFLLLVPIDRLVGNYVVAFNLLYLLGYPLAALACLWGLRRLGVATAPAIALAGLYAVLPYHLHRGEHHFLLSLYYGLPALLSYAVTTAAGRPAIPRPGPTRTRRAWLRAAAPALAATVLAGLMSAYYVAFAAIALLGAAAFGWLRTRRRWLPASAVVLGVVLALAFAVQVSPSLAHRLVNGTNHDVGTRGLSEVEDYPLKPADLVLPVPGHPIGPLRELRARYSQFESHSEPGVALGTIGTLGLLVALASLVAGATVQRPGRLVRRLGPIGWLAAVMIAAGVLGGGATLVSLLTGTYLRAWDRTAIAIAFFALAAVGVLVTALGARLRHSWRTAGLAGIAAVLLAGGLADQALTRAWLPDYQDLDRRWRADAAFIAQAEQALPVGTMVQQLPYLPWPERFRYDVPANEHLRPYLHSRQLRWAAARMAGREPGWFSIVSRSPPDHVIELSQAMGYGAIYVDSAAYPTMAGTATTAQQLLDGLRARLGEPVAVGPAARRVIFALPSAPVEDQLRADALDPIWLRWASGFSALRVQEERIEHRLVGPASVELRNDRADPRAAVIQLTLYRLAPEPAEVAITWPDGTSERLVVTSTAATHRREVIVPAGFSRIDLHVAASTFGERRLALADVAVVDRSLARLLPAAVAGELP